MIQVKCGDMKGVAVWYDKQVVGLHLSREVMI